MVDLMLPYSAAPGGVQHQVAGVPRRECMAVFVPRVSPKWIVISTGASSEQTWGSNGRQSGDHDGEVTRETSTGGHAGDLTEDDNRRPRACLHTVATDFSAESLNQIRKFARVVFPISLVLECQHMVNGRGIIKYRVWCIVLCWREKNFKQHIATQRGIHDQTLFATSLIVGALRGCTRFRTLSSAQVASIDIFTWVHSPIEVCPSQPVDNYCTSDYNSLLHVNHVHFRLVGDFRRAVPAEPLQQPDGEVRVYWRLNGNSSMSFVTFLGVVVAMDQSEVTMREKMELAWLFSVVPSPCCFDGSGCDVSAIGCATQWYLMCTVVLFFWRVRGEQPREGVFATSVTRSILCIETGCSWLLICAIHTQSSDLYIMGGCPENYHGVDEKIFYTVKCQPYWMCVRMRCSWMERWA